MSWYAGKILLSKLFISVELFLITFMVWWNNAIYVHQYVWSKNRLQKNREDFAPPLNKCGRPAPQLQVDQIHELKYGCSPFFKIGRSSEARHWRHIYLWHPLNSFPCASRLKTLDCTLHPSPHCSIRSRAKKRRLAVSAINSQTAERYNQIFRLLRPWRI